MAKLVTDSPSTLAKVRGPARTIEQLADALYLTASRAWQGGSSQHERIELGKEAVVDSLRAQSDKTLKALTELFQETRAAGIRSAMQYGTVACSGPNTAFDVPNAVLLGIKEVRSKRR